MAPVQLRYKYIYNNDGSGYYVESAVEILIINTMMFVNLLCVSWLLTFVCVSAVDPDTDDSSDVYLQISNDKDAGLNRYMEASEGEEIREKEDKRRLGSAFNVGRGSFYKSLATKQGTSKKHNMDDLTPEMEITSRVGRRNLGSAMNLLKFRNPMRMGFSGGQGRGRRRIASAINLKKNPSN